MESSMKDRNELKARMIAQLGMDAVTGAWIAETIRRFTAADVEGELNFFRSMQVSA
jgi:hypothetical protein